MIGREKEGKRLMAAAASKRSEFVAVYGRRRIGKTYLVRQLLGNRFTFCHTGIENGGVREQLRAFSSSMAEFGYSPARPIRSWMDAFDEIRRIVKESPAEKKIIFLDELPWMDTPKSGFVSALEFFWNGWASARDDVMLVICGSATSWIVNKLLKARGGLHNRTTDQIWLKPFTLGECREYMESLGVRLSPMDIAEGYMAMGGVPYYWSFFRGNLSLAQNIDELFFAPDARLRLEFGQLYSSLFKNPEPYMKIITALGEKAKGLTREELASRIAASESGKLSGWIEELEQCGFIRRYHPFGAVKKGYLCQLIDNYSLFYLRFIKENTRHDPRFWSSVYARPVHRVWAGLAFERLCLQHVDQLRSALGIGGVVSDVCAWRCVDGAEGGAQVDLVIDRDDRVINLCEMKYCDAPFEVSKKQDAELRRRRHVFERETGTAKTVHLTLVTSVGLADTEYKGVFQSVVTLDELFTGLTFERRLQN